MAYTFTKIACNSRNYGRARMKSTIKYIVVHYTANKTDTAVANGNYFKNNTPGVSAHYFVDDTTVVQSVPPLRVAYAVGGSKWSDCNKTGGGTMYGKITNTNSISIEMCSTNSVITTATQQNAIALIKTLRETYGNLPVYRHFDVTGKHCPGWTGWYGSNNLRWTAFLAMLGDSTIGTSTSKSTYTGTFPTLPSKGYLGKGDTGLQVRLLQKFLNWYNGGLVLSVDGSFGPITLKYVKAYQKAEGLTVDGYFGPASLAHAKTVKK